MPNTITPLTSVQAIPKSGGGQDIPYELDEWDQNDFTNNRLNMLRFEHLEIGLFEARILVDVSTVGNNVFDFRVGESTRTDLQISTANPVNYGGGTGDQWGLAYLKQQGAATRHNFEVPVSFFYVVTGTSGTWLNIQVGTNSAIRSADVKLYWRKVKRDPIPDIPTAPPKDKLNALEARIKRLEARF